MNVVRVGLLVIYLGGAYVLNRYLKDHLPAPGDGFVPSWLRPWIALMWIWGPMLWFFPGILWIGLLELSLLHILVLSFFLPLVCFVIFMLVVGGFPLSVSSSSYDKQTSLFMIGFVVLIGGLALLMALLTPDLSLLNFVLFLATVLTSPLTAIIALMRWTPEVIPVGEDADSPLRQAFALLFGFFSTMPKTRWVVEDGLVHTRISGSTGSGSGPGWLMTEPENVAILMVGPRLTRVVGPGVARTESGEVPYKVMDLRNQVRSAQVNAITRDGIEVHLSVSSRFRIDRGYRDVNLRAPWPYHNQRDVLEAAFSEEVDPSGKGPLDANTAHPWAELPIQIAAHKLEQAVSFYSLDQLYSGITDVQAARSGDNPQAELMRTHRRVERALSLPPVRDLGDPLTRTTLSKLVKRALRQILEPQGFEILDVGVGTPIRPLNHRVTEQRVEAWKSRFINKVMDWQASLQRQRYKALQRLHQDAREKMLSKMIEEISDYLADAYDQTKRNLIAYRMLESLITMARSPDVRALLPESAVPMLEALSQQVGEDEAPEGS